MAPGVGKVLDPSGAGAETDWAAGVPYYWYDNSSSTWKLQPGAPDPAQVINFSRGNDASYDDSIGAQEWDATVDSYGVTATVAAGNSGPAPRTVNDPALAYNVIGVGAFSGGGTTDPSDDSVFAWSSRGPTVGGRKKPDLVAVGDGGLAYSYYESTGKLWKYDSGTSYAAPQVGGGAILLAGAGIRDPKVVKAILINSARSGRATPAAAMGTQVGWLPDWGWGEMNLDAAFHERLNFARAQVPAGGALFFKATAQVPGDRATLVWNRRVADCQPLRQGCYYDTTSGFRVYTLSNLDLAQYDATTGSPRAASTSAVDNVEQVRAPTAGSVVYKVTAGEVDGSSEPFAIAGTRPLTPLVTPQPTASLAVDAHGPVRANGLVRVDAVIANPSPDLTAETAQVALNLPAGVELVAGQQTQTLGTLQTKGSPGDRASVSWVVRGTGAGLKQLIATTSATRYGSTFRSSATASFTVDAEPPHVSIAAPAGSTAETSIPVSWNATDDGSGVASYDVELSTNGAPFTPWLAATTRTSAAYAATPGNTYRFGVRATDVFGNTSGYVTTADVVVTRAGSEPGTSPPTGPPSPPGDAGGALPSPELKVIAIGRHGARLVVRGAVARGANGKVTGRLTARVRRRRRVARASTYAQLRSFRLTLAIPRVARGARRASLAIDYLGGDGFATETIRMAVRWR